MMPTMMHGGCASAQRKMTVTPDLAVLVRRSLMTWSLTILLVCCWSHLKAAAPLAPSNSVGAAQQPALSDTDLRADLGGDSLVLLRGKSNVMNLNDSCVPDAKDDDDVSEDDTEVSCGILFTSDLAWVTSKAQIVTTVF